MALPTLEKFTAKELLETLGKLMNLDIEPGVLRRDAS